MEGMCSLTAIVFRRAQKADAIVLRRWSWTRDPPFTFIHATSLTLQYAFGSETKTEDGPDASSHHSQRLYEARY